jgi:hypothetical protein
MSDEPPDSARDLVQVIKGAGSAAGGLAIAAFGVFGGRYAAMFMPPFDYYASWICLVAMMTGLLIAIWRAVWPPSGGTRR